MNKTSSPSGGWKKARHACPCRRHHGASPAKPTAAPGPLLPPAHPQAAPTASRTSSDFVPWDAACHIRADWRSWL